MKKGHYVKGDDPSTPDVNEAWTTKVVKKVTRKVITELHFCHYYDITI